jgi:hypothetical protein
MKKLVRSELRKLIKAVGVGKAAEMYGVTYERMRQICVMWNIPRRGWDRIAKLILVDDEKK